MSSCCWCCQSRMREFENRKTPQGLLYRNLDHFVNADGKFLFCRYWSPPTAPSIYCLSLAALELTVLLGYFRKQLRIVHIAVGLESLVDQIRALLMLIHNAGDHSGRYTDLVSLFLKKSMFVFSHDHIGHGQSEGDRLWVSDFRIYVRDCVQHLDMMKRQFPALRIYIFAVSMGALIATYVFYDRPLDIAGLIFIAPLVLMNPESATRGKMLFSKMVNHLLPNAPLGYIDPQATSRDEAQVEDYINDPLNCHVAVRVRFAFEVLTALSKVEKVFPIITVPLLILHGEKDKLSDVRGSYIMYGKVASTDKTFKVFNDCYHELQNELPEVAAEVMLLIDNWLEARLPK